MTSAMLNLIFEKMSLHFQGLPQWLSGKESACSTGDLCSMPRLVRLPGNSHRQRNLAGYSPWGHKKLDTIEPTEYICKLFVDHTVRMSGSTLEKS